MIHNKIIILFVFIFLFIYNVYSQTRITEISVIDISKESFVNENNNNLYNKYPSSSNIATCNFKFRFLASTTLPVPSEELSDNLIISGIGSTYFIQSINLKNESSTVFDIESSLGVPIEIDFLSLSYEIISEPYYSIIYMTTYAGLFKLNGLKYNLPQINLVSTSYASATNFFGNYYVCNFNFQNYMQSLTDDWVIQIQFTNQVMKLNFTSPYTKNNTNLPYNFKTYPETENDYINYIKNCEVGCPPLYTFNLNTSSPSSYLKHYDRDGFPFNSILSQFPPRLISSINGVDTYIGSFGEYNNSLVFYSLNETETIEYKSTNISIDNSITNFQDIFLASTSSVYNSITSPPLTTVKVQDNGINKNYMLYLSINPPNGYENGFETDFPFGFISGNNLGFTYGVTFMQYNQSNVLTKTMKVKVDTKISKFNVTIPTYNYINDQTSTTTITSFEVFELENEDKMIIIVGFIDKFGISQIKIPTLFNNILGCELLVSGNSNEGVFEMVANQRDFYMNLGYFVNIKNKIGISTPLSAESVISMDDPTKVYNLPIFKPSSVSGYSISNVTFVKNYLDVTNKTIGNRMTFNITDIDNVYTPMGFKTTGKSLEYSMAMLDTKPIKWNEDIKLFQVDFFVLANTPVGVLPYLIMFDLKNYIESNSLPNLQQLFISKSDNVDVYGPVFSNIVKITSNAPNGIIGWTVTIDDLVNGLDYGYFIVFGSIDNSIYNFTITPSTDNRYFVAGDKYSGQYNIFINLTNNYSPQVCLSQDYIIYEIHLVDTLGWNSHFAIYNTNDLTIGGYSIKGYVNPFINYLNDSTINIINYSCGSSQIPETGSTNLIYFMSSKSSMDLGKLDRNVTFDFQVENKQFGLKENQYPVVYLTVPDLESVVKCISTIVQMNSTFATYQCNIELPFAYGYTYGGFIISVYGFINNGGYYDGFTSQMLKDLGQSYFIDTSVLSLDQAAITRASEISTSGGSLWIYGRSLKGNSFTIHYLDGINSNSTILIPSKEYNSAVFLKGILPTLKPFIIQTNSKQSNEFIITPINYHLFDSPSDSSSSSTSNPPSIPIPTNAPQKCIGNPECGGNNKGVCKESGCVCIYPWVGNDCLSKVIIVPPPKINNTSPTVIFPSVPSSDGNTTNGDSEEETVFYKSLISLVSLRELDFKDVEIKTYIFKQWIFTPINDSTSQYFTNITNSDSSIITNITATIQWYNETTNIQFASSNLIMNPSTIKYTIEITKYPFSNNLNQLQLLMSASFESTQQQSCSQTEFGDTSSGDNSNYIKLNIEDHSLYGRFIKRALIDSTPKSITNKLLDSSLNTIDQSNSPSPSSSSSIQSFIGISIPNYQKSIIIDPDFSILLSSDSDLPSSCNSNSGLSSSQIAGIVIGCFAFATVIVVSVIYAIYKYKQISKFRIDLSKKMKNIN